MLTWQLIGIWEGPKKPWFIYKNCVSMFKLQSPSKYSPFDATHLSSHFLHGSKQFLNLSIFSLLVFLAFFCFTVSTSAKCFFLRTFFIRGNKKSCPGWDWVIRRMGHRHDAIFGQTQSAVWAGLLVKHPSWSGQCIERVLKKISLKPNTASHNNASWYIDTDGS